MRIISGIAGGLRLTAPRGQAIRPTTDRVKESLFATLGDIQDYCVVDLFAGSGALGLEALSRGAARVFFVEQDRRHARLVEENLGKVLKAFGEGALPETGVIQGSASQVPRVLSRLSGRIDLILADPPYASAPGGYGPAELLEDPGLADWAGQALLVLEHASDRPLPFHPLSTWKPIRQRRYGSTTLSYCRQQPRSTT